MKKWIAILLTLCLSLGLLSGCDKDPTTVPGTTTVPPATTTPGVDYANATVIVYTANIRGDVTMYSKIAALRDRYLSMGATVYLVDAGNYLQGSAYANGDMGLTIYNLMDAVRYDVAAMGLYEFVYGDAALGYTSHGDYTKHYTQAELYLGAEKLTYQQNASWEKEPVYATRPGKSAAKFQVICSNLLAGEENSGYYAFAPSTVLGTDFRIGFVSALSEDTVRSLREENLFGYSFSDIAAPECDILVALGGGDGDIVIPAPADGQMAAGAYVIDHNSGQIIHETANLSVTHPQVDAILDSLPVESVIAVSDKLFDGTASANCNSQTALGTLVADALKWYAESALEGLEYPVVGLFSGGNCRDFLYSGAILETDLRNALHVSTKGVGVVYMTGQQILEMLEAATQQPDCPGWAQISGLEYTVDTEKPYDFGAAYGVYYKANSINRVSITTEGFDLEATYAVVSDMLLLNGEDTYYICKDLDIVAYGESGLDTCEIVTTYIQYALDGKLSD